MPITVPLDDDANDRCNYCDGLPGIYPPCNLCGRSTMKPEEQHRQTHGELPRSDNGE